MRIRAKIFPLAVFIFALFFKGDCKTDPVVGSDDVFILSGAVIQVNQKSLSNNQLVTSGIVTNNGTTTYTPTWYLEGEFYADTTYVLKLGGINQAFTFSLAPGEQTFWELRFSSSNVDVNQYPNFGVKNLRTVRPK